MNCLKELKSSVCGCSFRTGTLIIGYLGVFFYTVISITMVIIVVLNATGKLSTGKIEHSKPTNEEKQILYTVLGIPLTFGIGFDIVNILLLFGVYKKKLPCVNVYIWFNSIWVACHLLLTVVIFFWTFYASVISLVCLVLEFYCLLIVNSYYYAMKREEVLATIAQSRL